MYSETAFKIDVWDVAVIGGGPAGMMAAATAAAEGVSVLLLEKNDELGKKLSITGGGRCNVTNNKPVVREMLALYQEEGKYLFSTFTQHGVVESKDWFEGKGVTLKEENEGRLFPTTDSAETIREVLVAELKKTNVTVASNQEVISVSKEGDTFHIKTKSNHFLAKSCVLATGGYARPDTGSTGDGFKWLNQMGHTIIPNDNALVPVTLKTSWTKKLSGLTLPDVKVSVWSEGKKFTAKTGRLLFTHVGLTGPLILNMSKQIADLHAYNPVELRLDLFPHLDAGQCKDFLKDLLDSNKKLQNALSAELPSQLVKGFLEQLDIDGETPCHSVKKEDRTALLQYLKAVPLEVSGLLGPEKAIVSSGGVSLDEINFKTMESRKVSGLFVVGDLLNINRPSGGYSLQLCWSTGYVAGQSSAQEMG